MSNLTQLKASIKQDIDNHQQVIDSRRDELSVLTRCDGAVPPSQILDALNRYSLLDLLNKTEVLKAVREGTGLGLREANVLVNTVLY